MHVHYIVVRIRCIILFYSYEKIFEDAHHFVVIDSINPRGINW